MQETPMAAPNPGFQITGRHVLLAFIAFFGVVIAVNVVFVRLAVSSFPGEQVEKSYYQGLNYNEVLADKEHQLAQGYKLLLVDMPTAGPTATIKVKFVGPDGEPVYRARISGEIVRPTTDEGRRLIDFYPLPNGYFEADVSGLEAGAWDLSLMATAQETGENAIEATTRLSVK